VQDDYALQADEFAEANSFDAGPARKMIINGLNGHKHDCRPMTFKLSELPDLPALKQLARALWRNGSIRGAALFVGAGFSKNADKAPDTPKPPDWNELLSELIQQLYPNNQASAPKDALRIAEEYRIYFGQAVLDGFIRTRFPDRAWLPGPMHLRALVPLHRDYDSLTG
jgi:hypothetical protein